MADKHDLVIVGGGIAAVSAAEAFRERDENGSILILSEEDRAPYRRTKLSKRIVDGFETDELAIYPAEWYEERRIDLETNRKIVAVDPDAHEVEDADGKRYAYGKLVLATGGAPVFPGTIPAGETGSFFVLHSARDAERIMKAARKAKKVLISPETCPSVFSVTSRASCRSSYRRVVVVAVNVTPASDCSNACSCDSSTSVQPPSRSSCSGTAGCRGAP